MVLSMIWKIKIKDLDQEVQPKGNQKVFQEVELIVWKLLQVENVKMPKSSKIIQNYPKCIQNKSS